MPTDPDPDPDPESHPPSGTLPQDKVRSATEARASRVRRLARSYALTAALLGVSSVAAALWASTRAQALLLGGLGSWCAASLSWVALAYGVQRPQLLGPSDWGLATTVLSAVLSAPYRYAARVNAYLRSLKDRGGRGGSALADQSVCIGDVALSCAMAVEGPTLSTCPERPPKHCAGLHVRLPLLADTPPRPMELSRAVEQIERLQRQKQGRVRIHGLAGSSRPVVVAVAWMLHTGQADSVSQALTVVQTRWPGPKLRCDSVRALEAWQALN